MITKRIRELDPSPILSLDARIKELNARGKEVINLTAGEPDGATPEHIKQAGIQAIKKGYTHYAPPAGMSELRYAIAQKLKRENKIEYQSSQIVVGVGSKQLLYHAFLTLVDPGDEVLVATPTWATYSEQIKLAGGVPVIIPLRPPFQLMARDIERHRTKKTKLILLNSPSNPTGAVIDPQELQKIAVIAVKQNLIVISDEIYEKILYEGKHASIASFGRAINERTVTVNGVSKAYAMTGWRVGYAAGPQEIINAMIALSGQTTSGTSSVSQYAALAAITGSQSCVKSMVREFRRRRAFVMKALARIPGVSMTNPQGAFYGFINIEKLLDDPYPSSQAWAEALLNEAKVGVVPGEAFLAPGYVRLSFAASMKELKEGVERIKRFIGL